MASITVILSIACILFIILTIYVYKHKEQYVYDRDGEYKSFVPSKHLKDYNYDSPSCYTNRARPYVISNNKMTADCVQLGLDTTPPNWTLPVSDPDNPAYYNEFPSHPFNYA